MRPGPRPRPRPRPRQDKSRPRQGQDKTKTKTRQVKAKIQMYRGILPQSDSDWGEFLYTFDLGLFSLVLLDTQPSIFMIYIVEAGERSFSRRGSRGSYHLSCLGRPLRRQDKTGQDKTKTQDQDPDKRQDKSRPRQGHD